MNLKMKLALTQYHGLTEPTVRQRLDAAVSKYVEQLAGDILASMRRLEENPQPPKPLILAVDHFEDDLLALYRHILERRGYRVSLASDGSQMLMKIHMYNPRLIITGLNVLHCYPPAYRWTLKNLAAPKAVPVLFMTAASEERIRREIPDSPSARVLRKPQATEPIINAIEDLLWSRREKGN